MIHRATHKNPKQAAGLSSEHFCQYPYALGVRVWAPSEMKSFPSGCANL